MRKRLDITPPDDRWAAYSVGTEVGGTKWDSKKERMKEVASQYGMRFTARVDEIVSGVLDELGIVGRMRVRYYAYGRKIARHFVKYHRIPDDAIDSMVTPISLSFIEMYRLDPNVAAAIYDALKRSRQELIRIVYGG